MNYSVIIAAAGSDGGRILRDTAFFHPHSSGKTILETTIELFHQDERCQQIIIVTNSADVSRVMQQYESGKLIFAFGGESRQISVYNGLMAVSQDIVLIHDGVRAWCRKEDIDHILAVMQEEKAAILAVKLKKSLKEVDGEYIKRSIIPKNLILAQTPQAFETRLLMQCHHKAKEVGYKAKDDAELIEQFSEQNIRVVIGSNANIDVTTLYDLD